MKLRHLSPSALAAWDWCPLHRYAASYRDRAPMTVNIPVSFGIAVHEAAEAFYRGQDWEGAWYRIWNVKSAELQVADLLDKKEGQRLGGRGFALLDALVALAIPGEPETPFLWKAPQMSIPFKGRIDLTDTNAHRVYDFKTANYAWTQKKADGMVWQPAIYSLAYLAEHGTWPSFAYIVMPLTGAPRADVLERVMTQEDAERAMVHCASILARIEGDDFPCWCPLSKEKPSSPDLSGKRTSAKALAALA